MTEHICMDGDDLNAQNTFDAPDRVTPRRIAPEKGRFQIREVLLPKRSFNVLRFKAEAGTGTV